MTENDEYVDTKQFPGWLPIMGETLGCTFLYCALKKAILKIARNFSEATFSAETFWKLWDNIL